MSEARSTPSFNEFNPTLIKFQKQVMKDFSTKINFGLGVQEFLFSGSVGSSKSILAAHIAVRHCVENSRARILLGRVALPDIKATIFKLIVEHLDGSFLIKERDYWVNESSGKILFRNGSEIISRSWADKKYEKVRSLALSGAIIEEATENRGDHQRAISEIKQRVGRLPAIKTNFILYCTNPDGPSHWLFKYFFEDVSETRHVYKSKTEDNPFLPKWYIEQLKKDLDPREARRMLYGEWVELNRERIYYAYDLTENYLKRRYKVIESLPVSITFDFNIASGKPMSCVFGQFDPRTESFHFFEEIIIHGARTESILEEAHVRGLLDLSVEYQIYGDATGEARSTNSLHSDYDIIRNYLNKYKRSNGQGLIYKMRIPRANPPIRTRHNIVNAYCLNSLRQRRLFVYENCKVLHEGMKLTALKEGSQYQEDDSKHYQHCTTAIGYFIVMKHNSPNMAPARMF